MSWQLVALIVVLGLLALPTLVVLVVLASLTVQGWFQSWPRGELRRGVWKR